MITNINIAIVLAIITLYGTDGCRWTNWHDYITIEPPTPVAPVTVCHAPPAVGNAVYHNSQPSYNPGETVTYQCVNQTFIGLFFVMDGDPSNICQNDGSWSKQYGDEDFPKCVRVEHNCPHNQEYTHCATGCPLKCGEERDEGCMDQCVTGCACPSQAPYLTSSGMCVTEEMCPSDETTTTTRPTTTPTTTPTTPLTTTPTTTPVVDTYCIIYSPCRPGYQCVDVNDGSDYKCCRRGEPDNCYGGRFTTTTLPETSTAPGSCGTPPEVINDAQLMPPPMETFAPGDSVTYQCNPGFISVGGDNLVCNNGSWAAPFGSDEPSCLPADVDSDVVIILDNDKLVDNCDAKQDFLGEAPHNANEAEFSINFPYFYRQLVVSKMLSTNWRSNSSRWALKYSSESDDCSDYGLLRSFDEPIDELMRDGQYSCADDVFGWFGIQCSDKYLDSEAGTNRKMIILFSQDTEFILFRPNVWRFYVGDSAEEIGADIFVISTEGRESENYQENVDYWNQLVCDKANGETCLFNGAFIGSQWDDVEQLNNEIRNFYVQQE